MKKKIRINLEKVKLLITNVKSGVANTHIILSHGPTLNLHIFSKFAQYRFMPKTKIIEEKNLI